RSPSATGQRPSGRRPPSGGSPRVAGGRRRDGTGRCVASIATSVLVSRAIVATSRSRATSPRRTPVRPVVVGLLRHLPRVGSLLKKALAGGSLFALVAERLYTSLSASGGWPRHPLAPGDPNYTVTEA